MLTVHRSDRASLTLLVSTSLLLLLTLLLGSTPRPAHAQPDADCPGDMGSAPDGILAYPNVDGVPVYGQFPTRRNGANGYILCTAVPDDERMFFGWGIDYELDAVNLDCPTGLYYVDELDPPGLCEMAVVGPTLYTINQWGLDEPIPGTGPNPYLGIQHTVARWGQGPGDNIDVFVQNHSADTAYVNLLIDWDPDGTWGVGGVFETGGPATAASDPTVTTTSSSEGTELGSSLTPTSHHNVAVMWNRSMSNFPVPPGFAGWLSNLNAPGFITGGRSSGGTFWARFVITPTPLPSNWGGGGNYRGGGVLDFAFRLPNNPPGGGAEEIGCEFGDAPDNVPAYALSGIVIGKFPTCMLGSGGYIVHTGISGSMTFGPYEDLESNGNADDCAFWSYDRDELFQDGDAGLVFPSPWSFAGIEYQAGPVGSNHLLGNACSPLNWGVDIEMSYQNMTFVPAYINVLFDFNGNGEWGGQFYCASTGQLVSEHAIVNVRVSPGSAGNLSTILHGMGLGNTPIGSEGFVWARFTISEFPVPTSGPGWNGSGIFGDGETEDYLFKIGPPLAPAPGQPAPLATLLPVEWSPESSIVVNSDECAGDLGDAPDAIRAYSNVNGLPLDGGFPTRREGANGFVLHAARTSDDNCYFGAEVDFEWDATGTCATSPHDVDEPTSPTDCDPGLHGPQTYTIDGSGNEVIAFFDPGSEPFLGNGLDRVSWGQGPGQVDLFVTNRLDDTAWVNILIDFDRDGNWAPGTGAPALINRDLLDPASHDNDIVIAWNRGMMNFPIPAGFTGWLSWLNPTPLALAGNGGFAWMRCTISGEPIDGQWDGSGTFSEGESEDYLVQLAPAGYGPGELGDAPDGHMAYPSTGTLGQFPTCRTSPNGFVLHMSGASMHFGFSVDHEFDGNATNCPFTPYDDDDRYQDGDAGLLHPEPWTVFGVETPLGPGFQSRELGTACEVVNWGTDIDVLVTNLASAAGFVNVLFDFNGDGKWGGSFLCPLSGNLVKEHAVENAPVGSGVVSPLSAIIGARPLVLGDEGYVWARFTISDTPVPADWDGAGLFGSGETEDYLFHVDAPSVAGVDDGSGLGGSLRLAQNQPNPVSATTRIAFRLESAGAARLELFDVLGRRVRTLVDGNEPAGLRVVEWDRSTDGGDRVPPGIYLYRLEAGGKVDTRKLVVTD
jgi:hypothetical protein